MSVPAPVIAEVERETVRRRTFAVISHPDAGKSTITEALALHSRAIDQAGAVHGKAGRKAVVSDWMALEQQRGISITSAVLQFAYRDVVFNLLDTPGHADFSEDTYRVLTAVDCAVMLLDAAKGLEPQTLKLFEVCRLRRIPVITFINKWDRPGRDPLELLDEISQRIGLQPTPITWPVGIAGQMRGLLDADGGQMTAYTKTAGGATTAVEHDLDPAAAEAAYGAGARGGRADAVRCRHPSADSRVRGTHARRTSALRCGAAHRPRQRASARRRNRSRGDDPRA